MLFKTEKLTRERERERERLNRVSRAVGEECLCCVFCEEEGLNGREEEGEEEEEEKEKRPNKTKALLLCTQIL